MNGMDIRRILPIAVIAIVTYMLLLEWQTFEKDKKAEAAAQIEQSTIPSATAINNLNSETPNAAVPDVSQAPSDDVPSIAQPAPKVVDGITPQQGLISVKTDVLDVKISPAGGDIVYVGLLQHLESLDGEPKAFKLLQQSIEHNYVAQSGLIGPNGTDKSGARPMFSTAQTQYQLGEGQDTLNVDLTLTQTDGSVITKRYTFVRDNYLVNMSYIIQNKTSQPWQANFYAQLKRDNTPDPSASGGMLGIQPFLGVATTTDDKRFMKIAFDDIRDEKFSASKKEGWIAMIQHYFLTAWIPEKANTYNYSTIVTRSGDNLARLIGPTVSVPAGATQTIDSQFYAGPKDQYKLEKIADGLDLSVDYGILWMIAQPLYALMHGFATGEFHIFKTTFDIGIGLGNWGFAIILLTILIKLIFFYPSAMSYRSMAKMRKLQPKLASIKDRHPEDRQKQSQEMMALYRKEGVNPIGGCLPILIQMPVFIALYWVLLESVELRHAPFIGYIRDLSAMDPYFIMPLIMGASMFIQQKLNPPPQDPMQAKILQWMPVMFTVFFLWFPAGLVLYWVVNNLLSIAQQYIITRQIEKAD